jgi:exopolysaccharide biosynthesis polyprenyl glycosylphosphotransferase
VSASQIVTPEPETGGQPSLVALSEPAALTALHRDLAAATHEGPTPRDTRRRRLLAGSDVLAMIASYGAVWLIDPPNVALTSRGWLLAAVPLWIIINKLLGLYDRDANVVSRSTVDEIPRLLQSVLIGTASVFMLAPLAPNFDVYRGQALLFGGFAVILFPLLRSMTRRAISGREDAERCVILGSGVVARQLAAKLDKHPEYHVELVGFIDEDWAHQDPAPTGLTLLGDVGEFERIVTAHGVERVLIAFSTMSHEDLIRVMRISKQLRVKVMVVPRLFEAFGDGVEIDQVEGMTLIGLRGLSRTRSSMAIKRAMDFGVAFTGIALLSPALVAIAIAVRMTSRGPVLYAQRRIGRNDRPFSMLKFRTMVDGADALKADLAHLNEVPEPMFKITNDPRVTRIGNVLRRYSLDELPQLWNVLRGDMSLVGPRPLIPSEDDRVLGRHRARLELTPGLTGPWQVMGRNALPFDEMVKLDYLYAVEWSLWNDLRLLIRTAPAVLRGNGR